MTSDPRPNLLLLLTDQQRLDTLNGLARAFDVKTPNLDRLLRAGVVFSNCHCTAPICSPSRATLMTGRHPQEVGMAGNLYAPCPPLSPAIPTLGKLLRAAGYQTCYHGKWHLGGDVKEHGFEIGDECSHDETTRLEAGRLWRDRDWILNERPFFHVVSFLDPHDLYFFDPEATAGPDFQRPWSNLGRAPSEFPETVRRLRVEWPEEKWGAYHRFYAERVAKVDADIGRLLDDLRCSGFFPNTWIIFASDHGDMAGEQDLPFKGPYMYEGVTRVPLVIVPPQTRFLGDCTRKMDTPVMVTGREVGALCSLIDVVPTLLDLAQAKTPDACTGRSLLPWVRDPEKSDDAHEMVFAQWFRPGVRMARTRDWKLVWHAGGFEELFHLAEDPHETRNLADSKDRTIRAVRTGMRKRLCSHLIAIGDPEAASWTTHRDREDDTHPHADASASNPFLTDIADAGTT